MTASRRTLPLDPTLPEFGELAALMSGRQSLVLATCRDGNPYCSLMAHAATSDLRTVILASPAKSRKVDNIRANPAVSLLITSQTRAEASGETSPMAVTITGTAEIITPEKAEAFTSLFLTRHPDLARFWSAPTTAIIRISVLGIMQVRHFQEITEFVP